MRKGRQRKAELMKVSTGSAHQKMIVIGVRIEHIYILMPTQSCTIRIGAYLLLTVFDKLTDKKQ